MKKKHLFATTSMLFGALLGVFGSNVNAAESPEGYVIDSRGMAVKSGTGLCWRTGYWSPAMAIQECDRRLKSLAAPDLWSAVSTTPARNRAAQEYSSRTSALGRL